MAKKEIMLVCAAGMSTSMLVSRMQKSAEDRGLEVEIFAVSANEADSKMETQAIDVMMLGPQVRYMKSKFEEKADQQGIAIDVINMQDYGMMNGEKVLDRALELME